MTIRTRLMITLLACGLAPMAAVSFLSQRLSESEAEVLTAAATKALEERAHAQLESTVAARRNDILHYFQSVQAHVASLARQSVLVDNLPRLSQGMLDLAKDQPAEAQQAARTELSRYYQGDFESEYRRQAQRNGNGMAALAQLDAPAVMAQLLYVQRNPNPLGRKHELHDAKDGSLYSQVHDTVHDELVASQQAFGYYDVFLVDETGRIVYSVFKELDYGTSLVSGPWSRSNLGELHRKLQGTPRGEVAFVDFACYTPSYDGPAAFLGAPLFAGDRRLGQLIVQLRSTASTPSRRRRRAWARPSRSCSSAPTT